MKRTVTFSSYLFKILIIAVLFIALPMAFSFGGQLPTTGSFLVSCVCFFILTLVSVYLILGVKYIKYYAFAFIIQIIIGIAHYLLFVDSSYFASSGAISSSFWHEYNSTFSAIEGLNEERVNGSIFSFNSNFLGGGQHSEIWQVVSLPFYFIGHKWLNYAPLNVFSTLLASVNLVFLFKRNVNDVNKEKHLKFWTAYFPLFLLNDMLWRDPFGIALISIGLVMLVLSNTPVTNVISLVSLGYVSFMQRIMYLPIAGVAFTFHNVKNVKSKALKFLMIPIFILLLMFLINTANEANPEDYNAGYVNNMSILALPLKIIFGLIGPFPWHRFPELVALEPAFSYQLSHYFQGIFQVGFLITVISNFKKDAFKKIDGVTMMGFGIMLSGFLTKQMHIGYIAEGLLFTLPWFFTMFSTSSINKGIRISFLILFLLNLLTLITGHVGLSGIWR